jgi:hypothetical protein
MLEPAIFIGCAFDRRLVASTNNFHNRLDRDVKESAHLPPGIAVRFAHKAMANHRDI